MLNLQFCFSFIRLEFFLVYSIPDIITDPALEIAYKAVKSISRMIVDTTKKIDWVNPMRSKTFYDSICSDMSVTYSMNVFDTLLDGKSDLYS